MKGGYLERRQTAWVTRDAALTPRWAYGNLAEKMAPTAMSGAIASLADQLDGGGGFDCALVNLYPPDQRTGMKWHSDPDQNTLFGVDTAVVSLGAPAFFKLRRRRPGAPGEKGSKGSKDSDEMYKVLCLHGDLITMTKDCQEVFEHAVEDRGGMREEKWGGGGRVSVVFKKSLAAVVKAV